MFQSIKFYFLYAKYFYISKFLLKAQDELFSINSIRYQIDTNKTSLVNLFWVFFILFGQSPIFIPFTKQVIEKVTHSSLLITQGSPFLYINIKKIISFLLLYSSPELTNLGDKKKTKINTISLQNNDYFKELSEIPNIFVEPYNILLTFAFSNDKQISIFEKITIFRFLQFPISIRWNSKPSIKKRMVYKKRKGNIIK